MAVSFFCIAFRQQ